MTSLYTFMSLPNNDMIANHRGYLRRIRRWLDRISDGSHMDCENLLHLIALEALMTLETLGAEA
jgi:hypothetical protein